MDYDFSGLTNAQAWLLTVQGWQIGQRYPDGSVWPQPRKATVRKLIERGLVTVRECKVPTSLGSVTVDEYEVPIAVHMAWCFECDKRENRRAA